MNKSSNPNGDPMQDRQVDTPGGERNPTFPNALTITNGIQSPVSWLVVALVGAIAGTRQLRRLLSAIA